MSKCKICKKDILGNIFNYCSECCSSGKCGICYKDVKIDGAALCLKCNKEIKNE